MQYSKWLSLSLETRNKIAVAFDIQKKGPTEVFSNTIKSDGYLVQDIDAALTVKAMQDYLGSTETDKDLLAQKLIDVMEGNVAPEVEATPAPAEVKASGTFDPASLEPMPVEPKKKSVRKKKAVVKKAVKKVIKKKK